ncbi:MAG: S-layer homology domain-containing protein [Marinisporobacter sp.]|jgi:hypothetical protein|nr:S-layer homology domain-containing protein [Marinisporobacter sp.]
MKINKKFFSFLLVVLMIATTIFLSFADGIHIEPKQDTYRSGQTIKLTAEDGKDGHMKWYEIDENGEKHDWGGTGKVVDNHLRRDFNDTGETVTTVVYAVYETVSGSVYQSVEIPVEPDPKPLELVDMYPKDGSIGLKTDTEFSLIFNQPVEFNEKYESFSGEQVYIPYYDKEGEWIGSYPNYDAEVKHKLIFSDETPEKVTIQICDEEGKPIGLKENFEYSIIPSWGAIQAKTMNPYLKDDYYTNKDIQWSSINTFQIPQTIEINPPNKTIYTGESFQLSLTAVDDKGKNIADYQPAWGTSNPGVAMVSPEGILQARTSGKVTITASVKEKEGISTSIDVEIKKGNEYGEKIKAAIDGAAKVALDSQYSMDWVALGLARAGKSQMIPKDYFENTIKELKAKEVEEDDKIAAPTEYERRVLGVLAAGGNPRNIAGYDLVEKTYSGDLEGQGINSVIFGLIALDAGEFDVPKDARWTREKLIHNLLDNECTYTKDEKELIGGWALKTDANPNPPSDPDITGMAMTALAPYNNDEHPKVKEAIGRAVEYLSATQQDSGGYFSWNTANSESCAQAIMGLCTNGINPLSEKFTKNGNNLLDALLSFELPNHGGFAHMIVNDELKLNGMSNEQALYALDQYMYYLEGKGSIYHWGKDNIAPTIKVENLPEEIVSEDGKIQFDVHAKDNRDGDIVPQVKFDNQVVPKNGAGKYEIVLKEGKNTITVVATDASNNKIEKEYTIIRYKQIYQAGQNIALKKNVPIKIEGIDGTIDIDLGAMNVENEAALNVTDETQNEAYQPSEDIGLKVAGQIINFDFKGIHVDEQHPATLRLSVKEGINPSKASLYYFNKETKKWEYVPSAYKEGKLIAQVTHFSVYGILVDEKAPENVGVQSKMVASDKVLLNLSAEDDSLVKEYQIFRDDYSEEEPAIIARTNQFLDDEVQPNTKYQYKIKAVDVFGNISDFSEVLEITTPKEGTSGEVEEPEEKRESVYIRIEGYDHTILPRTKITVPLFDLTEYLKKGTGDTATDEGNWGVDQFKSPTVAHAIVKALENNGIRYDFQDYGWGLYIAMIDGEREKDHKGMSGWLYRINDSLAQVGCQGTNISEDDEIVWYYGAYGFDNVYAKMTADKTSVGVGVEVKIHTDGYENGFSNNVSPLKDATVLVNGEPFEMDGKVVKTDREGNATLKFDENGMYEISLIRYAERGKRYIDIARPVPISIKVGTGESSSPEQKVENAEYKEESKVVNDKNAKESEVVKAVDHAAEKLSKNADAVKSEEDAKKLISHGKDVSKIIEKAIERVKNEESAKNIAKESTKIINLLGKSAEKLTKEEDKKDISKVIEDNIDITLKAMDKIKNQTDLNDIVSNVIDNIKNISKNIGEKNEKNMMKKAIKIAEKAVEKATIKEIDTQRIVVEKEKAIVTVDKGTIKEIAKNTDITVKEIKKILKKNGLESKKKMENEVMIKIPKADQKEIEAKLPKEMMKVLKENDIKQAHIKTETTIFTLTRDTFEEKDKEIALSSKAIDRNGLTTLQKNKVPKGCMVVDLNAKVGEEKVSNFNEPISVSIPYKGEVKKGETVQVFLLNDNGTIESMGGVYDPDTKMVTFEAPHFSKYFAKKANEDEIVEVKVTFKDLAGYEWAKEAIEAMAKGKIINGRKAGIFDPSANITRAEFATLVTKMMGYPTEEMNLSFRDVSKDAWYYDYVGAAYKNGLINGRSETIFDPNGNITRQEMAVIVAKVLEKKGYEKANLDHLNIFEDTENIARWAKNSVSLCVKEKVISGMGDGNFAPKENANRAQAATMLYKIYNLINK